MFKDINKKIKELRVLYSVNNKLVNLIIKIFNLFMNLVQIASKFIILLFDLYYRIRKA